MSSVEIVPVSSPLNETEQKFVRRALRRKRLFLVLSVVGIVVALALPITYAILARAGHHYEMGPRYVIVILVLLNARQNLRQFRYAQILEKTAAEGLGGPSRA